jgi:hypothetical protein
MEDIPTGFPSIASRRQVLEVFKPRKSVWGWLSSFAIVAVLGILFVFTIHKYPRGDHSAWFAFGVIIAFMIPSIFFLSIFPTMRYSVGDDIIVLSCGPFKWTILIRSIRSIAEKDLEYLPLSEGWKLPGYTLFKIRYGGIGLVRMCATAMTKRILLIETDTDVWGITPTEVDSFIATIRRTRS